MIASVHIADLGPTRALAVLAKPPRPQSVPGSRSIEMGMTAPLSSSLVPKPQLGRVALVTFWDSDDDLDRFEQTHPLPAKFEGGWRVRLEALRAYGTHPGLTGDESRSRRTEHEGPSVVLTLGRLKWHRAIPFFKASARAEGAVLTAPGLTWATGIARPPFLATCSLWTDVTSLSAYAYGDEDPGHPDAITADRARTFHHREAFIRFRPYAVRGQLDGKNPLAADALPADALPADATRPSPTRSAD